jgi:hypothetical protein
MHPAVAVISSASHPIGRFGTTDQQREERTSHDGGDGPTARLGPAKPIADPHHD